MCTFASRVCQVPLWLAWRCLAGMKWFDLGLCNLWKNHRVVQLSWMNLMRCALCMCSCNGCALARFPFSRAILCAGWLLSQTQLMNPDYLPSSLPSLQCLSQPLPISPQRSLKKASWKFLLLASSTLMKMAASSTCRGNPLFLEPMGCGARTWVEASTHHSSPVQPTQEPHGTKPEKTNFCESSLYI